MYVTFNAVYKVKTAKISLRTPEKILGAWSFISIHSQRRWQVGVAGQLQVPAVPPQGNKLRYPLNGKFFAAGLVLKRLQTLAAKHERAYG
jgi:hypothetical protein